MKITIISGSTRADSGSRKVAGFAEKILSDSEHDVSVVDLHELALPVWTPENMPVFSETAKTLEESEAFVMVVPEWGGMAGPAMKNFILYVGKTMAHKPALLVGVSSGRGGAYPIAEMRMSSYKNTFINYMPEHIIVRNLKEVMESYDVSAGNEEAVYVKERFAKSIDLLVSYGKAFVQIREGRVYDLEKYGNGM